MKAVYIGAGLDIEPLNLHINDFIYIDKTGAKLTARDAKIFVDQFCVMCAPAMQDATINSTI